MCLSEASIVAIVCSLIAAVISIFSLHNRSKEKYKVKQDAILSALRFLDTFYSYLDYSSGIIPKKDDSYDSTKLTLEGRDCYERLCVSVRNREILEVFLSIVMSPSPNVVSLNSFRNLSRKELCLRRIKYDERSIFLSIISTEAMQRKEKK